MHKKLSFLFLFFLVSSFGFCQSKFVLQDEKPVKINFKLIHNLIIIPVEVNGVELSFLLDTGVSKPIIFNFLNLTEDLQINHTERIFLRGLGEGESIEALRSQENIFKIGNAVNLNQDLYVVFDPSMNFAPKLGVPIHGIIGYDLLKDFVVEISYSNRVIKLHNPDVYEYKTCRKCETFDLDFVSKKPYIKNEVVISDEKIPVKLLIDTGGGDALWLFEDKSKNISIPDNYFDDYLGKGLSGDVFGKRSRVNEFHIGKYKLSDVNVAFPDSSSIGQARKNKERNGSVSGDVLRRFNIIFNYPEKKITLKKNSYFKESFRYDKSGITLEHDGVRVVKELTIDRVYYSSSNTNNTANNDAINTTETYNFILAPAFTITQIRKGSPAEKAGLMKGDIILSVNNKSVHKEKLQEVIHMFYGNEGKRIKLQIDRRGTKMTFMIRLKNVL